MNQIERYLAPIMRQLSRLSGQAQLIEDCIRSGATEAAYENAVELERLSESFVLHTRDLPCEFGKPQAVVQVDEIVKDSFPCEVGHTDEGWFRLIIPRLLPKKSRNGSVEYIRSSVYPPMIDFFRSNPIKRLDDCVIIFRHVYARNTPEKRWRDHDNIEVKQVTDIVAWFTMTDDGPGICRHYYCSVSGEENRTEVFVVPRSDFPRWLSVYQD